MDWWKKEGSLKTNEEIFGKHQSTRKETIKLTLSTAGQQKAVNMRCTGTQVTF